MKYIDVEKLIAEIERRRKQRIEANEKIAKGEIFTDTEDEFNRSLARYGNRLVYQELFEIICFIEYLQQEQSEVDFEKELDRIWFDNKFGDYFDNSAVDFARIRTLCKHFFELGLAQKGE